MAATITSWFANNTTKNIDEEKEVKVVSLRAESLATIELRENSATRKHALEYLRNWVSKNKDIVNIRTDDSFLLRFLRAKKFSLPMTEQLMLKWLNLRKCFPQMCKNLDYYDPSLRQIIDDGYIFVSTNRDKNGRKVIVYNVGKFDPTKFTSYDMAKVHFLCYETLLEDQEDQILGFTHIVDVSGLSKNHIMNWCPTEFARIIKWGEQSLPIRHKEIHLVYLPKAVRYVYDFAKTKLSKKMNDRMIIHRTFETVHAKVGSLCLPKEYGGVVPAEDMMRQWKSELMGRCQIVKALDNMDILSTSGIQKKNDDNNGDCLTGSFRKLEVD